MITSWTSESSRNNAHINLVYYSAKQELKRNDKQNESQADKNKFIKITIFYKLH